MANTNRADIIKMLRAKGYSDAAIAGIIGNIDVETGGSFDYTQKQKKGNGYGLFQFDFLKPHYEKWLKDNKLTDSAQAQIDFFDDTIQGNSQDIIGRGNAAKLRKTLSGSSPTLIAEELSNVWLKPGKPHLQRRIRSADSQYNALQQMNAPQMGGAGNAPGSWGLVGMFADAYNNYKEGQKLDAMGEVVSPPLVDLPQRYSFEEQQAMSDMMSGVGNDQVPSANYNQAQAPKPQYFYDAPPAPQQPAQPQYETMEDLLLDKGLISPFDRYGGVY